MICTSRVLSPRDNRPLTSFPAGEVAKRYGFPTVAQQTQKVALLCLGGGYALADVAAYCAHFGLPVPSVEFVSVDGARNTYTGDANSADGECALDVQTVIGAGGGSVGVLVYGCPNTEAGYAHGLARIAADNLACVASTSWGLAEGQWSAAGVSAIAAVVARCENAGIPVFAASGDDGSRDGVAGNNCDFPASLSGVLGCGGTSLVAGPETAWSYGGGGFSALYRAPSWQTGIGPRRLVPDMAGNADPNSGYPVCLGGRWLTLGGTSAVAPLWAAGIALAVSVARSRAKGLLPWLWAKRNLTDITTGANGAFTAGVGPDPCTGLGTPNAAFFAALVESLKQPSPPKPPGAEHGLPVAGKLFDAGGNVVYSFPLSAA